MSTYAGTLVVDATNAHEVGAVSTVLDGITATITASGECSLATATESGGAASAACSFSGILVDVFSGTTTTTVITTAYTSLQTLMAVQIPDTSSGAIPTVDTSSSESSSTGSAPDSTSTKNGALKGRLGWGVAVGGGQASLSRDWAESEEGLSDWFMDPKNRLGGGDCYYLDNYCMMFVFNDRLESLQVLKNWFGSNKLCVVKVKLLLTGK